MAKMLKSVLSWIGIATVLGLTYWLVSGNIRHILLFDAFDRVSMPFVVGFGLLFILWSALPRWRRLENQERILWSANLPSRIGTFAQAVLSPAIILPSLTLVRGWAQSQDYPRLAGLAVVLAATLWTIWRGLRLAFDEGVSVKVSAEGVQLGRRRIAWSSIEAIESGFASLEGGAAILLADDRIVLSPHEKGPTGRALVAAVQRFNPGTAIREPAFQAEFGKAATA